MSDGRRDFEGRGKDWTPPITSHEGKPIDIPIREGVDLDPLPRPVTLDIRNCPEERPQFTFSMPAVYLDTSAGMVSAKVFIYKGTLVREYVIKRVSAFPLKAFTLCWTKGTWEEAIKPLVSAEFSYNENSEFSDVYEERARKEVKRKFSEYYSL